MVGWDGVRWDGMGWEAVGACSSCDWRQHGGRVPTGGLGTGIQHWVAPGGASPPGAAAAPVFILHAPAMAAAPAPCRLRLLPMPMPMPRRTTPSSSLLHPPLLPHPAVPRYAQVADGSLHPQTPPGCHPALSQLLGAIFSPDPLERPSFGITVARLEAVLHDVRQQAAAVQTDSLLGRWFKGAAAAASSGSLGSVGRG